MPKESEHDLAHCLPVHFLFAILFADSSADSMLQPTYLRSRLPPASQLPSFGGLLWGWPMGNFCDQKGSRVECDAYRFFPNHPRCVRGKIRSGRFAIQFERVSAQRFLQRRALLDLPVGRHGRAGAKAARIAPGAG